MLLQKKINNVDTRLLTTKLDSVFRKIPNLEPRNEVLFYKANIRFKLELKGGIHVTLPVKISVSTLENNTLMKISLNETKLGIYALLGGGFVAMIFMLLGKEMAALIFGCASFLVFYQIFKKAVHVSLVAYVDDLTRV